MTGSGLVAAARNAIRELRSDYERARRLAGHGADAKHTFHRRLAGAQLVCQPHTPPPSAHRLVVVIALAALR